MTKKPTKANEDTAILAFWLPDAVARRLAIPGGEAPEDLHVTLVYIGDVSGIEDPERLKEELARWVKHQLPVSGRINGTGRFTETGGDDAFYAVFDAPSLPQFRQSLVNELEWLGVPVNREHGFSPHITLAYLTEDQPNPVEKVEPLEMTFRWLSLQIGDEWTRFELTGEPVEGGKSADLIIPGGAIKALGDGRVGGPLVVWGSGDQKDLEGDYFDRTRSDLGWEGKERRMALYDHGLDETVGPREIGDGLKLIKVDDVGLWVETQLNLRDEYEAAMYDLARKRKLGWSSGTASHTVIREQDGLLRRWHIIEGSLTATPAEPRIQATPIKNYQPIQLKSLRESGSATGAATKRAPGAGRKRGVKHYKKSGGRTMKMLEALLESIGQLVPGLTDEQRNQLAAVLQLYYGQHDMGGDDDGMMMGDDEDYPPMRSAGRRYRNPANAPQQPDAKETVKATLEALGVEIPKQENGTGIKKVVEAILKEAGIEAPQQDDDGNTKRNAPARPPYDFKPHKGLGDEGGDEPDPDSPEGRQARLKSIAMMQFGETDSAIKGFARELYGDDYEVKRLHAHNAFGKYARYGKEALTADDRKVLKSVVLAPQQIRAMVMTGIEIKSVKTEMSEVIDTLGGFLVPEDVRLDMIERLPELSNIRQYADVGTTTSDVMTRVKVTGGNDQYESAVRVTWVGDTPAEDQADQAPTFGLEKTPIHIAKITVPVPMALLEDTAFPLTQKLSQWSANAYSIDENTQFLTGDGIAKPEGILPDSINLNTRLTEVAAGSTSAITDADKVIDVQYSVAQQYWGGARWTVARATTGSLRKLKAGDGHYLWRDGLEAGQPPTLLGFPVDMNESMPAIASSAYPVLFGNHGEGYQIADRIGMSLLRDEVTQAEQDIVKFLFRRRLGGQLKGEWAYAVLKMATS